jgi:hypothetical protein
MERMTDKKSDAQRVLQRVAEALGTDVSGLYSRNNPEPQRAQELSELIRVFEGIDDPNDRRVCLDFVRSAAARKPGR